ncbi:tyrosine recombinase XerC [Duganella callida]|uniref:Tyrosine recombinase XerC n=1 Tax=Duganella callida TaxID=2561932 RepID=A0A4Y9S0Q7_9BURK|nr:tyrosine recombinase XerC [Duganella callida]TFW13565.1 tyrosine recombinase XerC [Duganella callida]
MSDAPDSKLAWIDAYLAHLRGVRQLSPHTTAAYARDLQELATLTGAQDWAAIDQHAVRRLTARLHAQQLDPRSIARKLSSWRGFFGWLSERVALAANPVQGVRAPKRAKTLPRALSVDDAVRLVAPPPVTAGDGDPAALCNCAMFELLYSSGLRVSELASLDLTPRKGGGYVDLDSREVTVNGKGNKQRTVPVGGAALAALTAWLAVRPAPADGSDALFLSTRASRITPRVIQQRLQQHGVAQGAPVHVHPHMLRHSFASHVLQSSGDLRAVQEMLGHASIASTQVYTALDFQHLAAVYDKTHPRAKVK